MLKMILLAGVAIATSLTFSVDQAEAFGGRGYARRQARRTHYAPAPVVVQRVYAAPVVNHYRAPVYYQRPVSVTVGRYNSFYGPRYYSPYRSPYRGGVAIGIGW